jgi:hypothetical protein
MLFAGRILEGIRNGEIDVAYRRALRAPARVGGRQRVDDDGVVEFTAVEAVDEDAISDADARAAGYEGRAALMRMLSRDQRETVSCYRVGVRYVRERDPRLALRADDALSPEDAHSIVTRLDRWDRAGARGPWTRSTLRVISSNPGIVSTRLAEIVGMERLAFKANVRKLKGLGLTISHEIGYELSPRGRALLKQLETKDQT